MRRPPNSTVTGQNHSAKPTTVSTKFAARNSALGQQLSNSIYPNVLSEETRPWL